MICADADAEAGTKCKIEGKSGLLLDAGAEMEGGNMEGCSSIEE
jgi:hypothetical protein